MELISMYLYNRLPIAIENIRSVTFERLENKGWYTDARCSQRFHILNKRVQVDDQWYRAVVRFEKKVNEHHYRLSLPCPFLVMYCEPVNEEQTRWKDTKTLHGPTLKTATGYLVAGLPADVLEMIQKDLIDCVYHANY